MADGISVALAGRLALAKADEPMLEVELGLRARVALAYLVVERRRPVARGELAEAVWGENLPPTWRASLRGIVSRIRAALVDHRLDSVELTSGPAGYQLQFPSGVTVDVEVAATALERARAAVAEDERTALAEANCAIELSEGEFLGAAGVGAWVEQRQDQLARIHVDALELASEAARRCGQTKTAVWAAERAAAAWPLRESAHRSLMAAHAAAGNRADALRAYERCRHALVEELGVDPSRETEAAYLDLLGPEPATPGAPRGGVPRSNLPAPLTSFVGRQAEREELQRLLATGRLVTVTGLGGAGKSRLALEVADRRKHEFRDGVWLVELAGLGDARLVAAHVLGVLGLPDIPGCSAAESLAGHLADRQLLLRSRQLRASRRERR